jgi:acylglycerol lipase
MNFSKRSIITAAVVATLYVLSACSPLVNHPGKQVIAPKIENEYYLAVDGSKLPVRTWLPKNRPVTSAIIALHGFNDYSNFFTKPGKFLSSHGIASYAYDQRGFGSAPGRGLWSGIDAYTRDLSSFAEVIRARHPDVPLYILGESMGGAVTIVAMTGSHPPNVDGVILIAPAVWGRDTMPWYQRWLLAVSAHTLPWLELTGKGLHRSPSDNIEMLRALGRDPRVIKGTRIDTVYGLSNLMDEALSQAENLRVPTLVQYGKHDQIIPKSPIFLMLEKMPTATRKAFYENGYHMLLRDLQADKPLADIAAWITDHKQPLVHGTDNWN